MAVPGSNPPPRPPPPPPPRRKISAGSLEQVEQGRKCDEDESCKIGIVTIENNSKEKKPQV
jgi:hypothetical protein